ncbi:DUF1697 domain-containing protein [Cohnella cholangitidis]|uniref:DUF1697 domain-containing protein n=1 Tax=Cohnella cholangitidis TaxID=2598458 RepID=A0A7G5BSS9_9BACL|nr:DUF1697 domain-containing protein [Cohnella cholangitidis]QMV40013.1 DUF1697 domain-containing protein [Cohnella cholangitidis]
MINYVALLRGINVSGQKLIKMDHLKSVFEQLGYHRVRTYIQSGNVLFDSSDNDSVKVARQIEAKIEEEYSFPVTVVLRTIRELEEVVRNNPYPLEEMQKTDSLYVSFLSERPAEEAIAQCMALKNEADELVITDTEAYILIHKSYGTSKFSNNFLEKKLKVAATTRNWATVNKLIGMGQV